MSNTSFESIRPAGGDRPVSFRVEKALSLVVLALPLLSFVLSLIGWSIYGIDLPYFDDWRALNQQNIGEFSVERIFKAANGTLAPVGYVLDVLSQRLINGNSIIYQFSSYSVVMGALLFFQWKLLGSVLGDFSLAAACFSLTLLMLQPGGYWGRENLAYHQALPLVFVLWILWLALRSPMKGLPGLVFTTALGLLAGFSYISGAFAVLAMGIAFGTLSVIGDGSFKTWRPSAWCLTAAGLFSSGTQYYLSVFPRNGINPHPVLKAWPWESDFWWFLLGKIARAMYLPAEFPRASVTVTLLIVAAVLITATAGLRSLATRKSDQPEALRLSACCLTLLAVVSVYLLIVAAVRTNFRPNEVQGSMDVFVFGMNRFHFFWVTLLWPWCAATACVLVRHRLPHAGRAVHIGALLVASGLAVTAIKAGAINHFAYFRDDVFLRQGLQQCLMQRLQDGGPMRCDQVNFIPDLSQAYAHAHQIQASFVSLLPVPKVAMHSDFARTWFRYSRDPQNAQWLNAQVQARGEDFMLSRTGNPQLHVSLPAELPTRRCKLVEVLAQLKTSDSAQSRLLLQIGDELAFDAKHSQVQGILASEAGGYRDVRFLVDTPTGFGHSLRLDVFLEDPRFGLRDVEVRCRVLADS